MSTHSLKPGHVLGHGAIKADGDRDLGAPERIAHASCSTPALRHWFEDRGGWMVVFVLVASVVSLTACSEWRPRPDLKASTLTQPGEDCVRGHRIEQVGTTGRYSTPVVLVTSEPCTHPPTDSASVSKEDSHD